MLGNYAANSEDGYMLNTMQNMLHAFFFSYVHIKLCKALKWLRCIILLFFLLFLFYFRDVQLPQAFEAKYFRSLASRQQTPIGAPAQILV